MINKSIEIPKIQDAELLGCAIEGFRGLGEFDSYQEACSELVKIEYYIHPQEPWVDRYENRFIVYENGYSHLVGLNE